MRKDEVSFCDQCVFWDGREGDGSSGTGFLPQWARGLSHDCPMVSTKCPPPGPWLFAQGQGKFRKALNFWGNTKAGNKWHVICIVHVRLGQKPGYTPCPNQYKELAMKARTPALLLAAGMLSSALLMAGTDTAQAAPVSDNGFVQLAERHPGPPPGHVRKAPPPPPKKMHKTPPPPPKHDMRRPGPPPKHMAPPPPRHDRPGPPPRHDGRPGPR